ncbi:MAG: hypothetical protein MJA29_05710 [Candidatus Omnitrophica bacterium]|nr:hypothetical protein [Candidatus Omnitrophota bacterium]
MVLINNLVSSIKIFSKSILGFIEILGIKLFTNGHPLYFITIYRSPLSSYMADEECVHFIKNYNFDSDIVLVGDFNLPGLFGDTSKNYSSQYDLYDSLFIELGLFQKVNSPTRNNNILDYVLSTDQLLITNLKVAECFSTSDHKKIVFNLNIPFYNIKLHENKFYRDFKNADFSNMMDFIEKIDWDTILFIGENTIDNIWENFTNIINYAIYLFVPLKLYKFKKYKWSKNTRKLYNKKRKAWKHYKKCKNELNLNKYRNLAVSAKNSAFNDLKSSELNILNSKNLKTFYSFINSKLISRNSMPPLFKDGITYINSSDKANLLQEQFCLNFTDDNNILPLFLYRTDNILEDILINEEIVLNSLKKLPKNSAGPDGIPSLLKKLAQVVAKTLTIIFKYSFENSVIPSQWLEAKIIPIFKKGENANPSNYRPISLTVVASKVMERIIKDNMIKFLNENNLLNENQHGFLSNKSTLTNVLSTINKWIKWVNDRKVVHAAYIDFAKAFDSVSHRKLAYKLSKYGINGNLLSWIKTFLNNRQQYVLVDNSKSSSCLVKSGIPQGTVLGPILFAIYINDLVDVVKNSHISLYADDAKIFTYIDNNEVKSWLLQDNLIAVHEWSKIWQLNVAINKCSVFIFGHSLGTLPCYSVGSLDLEVVTEINDLGFILSSNKKFSAHCKKITKKACRISANVFRNFKNRDTNFLIKLFNTYIILIKLFNTYIRPVVEYGISVWNPYLLKDIDLVEKVLRSYTKRIPEISHLNYNDRLKTLKIKSLEHRRIIADLNLGYKIIHNLIGLEFDEFFTYSYITGVRSHNLKLVVPKVINEINKSNFFFAYLNCGIFCLLK